MVFCVLFGFLSQLLHFSIILKNITHLNREIILLFYFIIFLFYFILGFVFLLFATLLHLLASKNTAVISSATEHSAVVKFICSQMVLSLMTAEI